MRMDRLSCFVLQVLVALIGSVVIAAPPTKVAIATYETQVYNDGDVLLVDVHRDRRKFRFVVDTGASHTTIDSDSFKDLLSAQGAKVSKELANGGVQLGKIPNPKDLSVGGKLPIASSHLAVFNFRSISALHGARIDGVLGCDFLQDYVLRLNADEGRLLFARDIMQRVGTSYSFSRQLGCPTIEASLLGSSEATSEGQQWMIDTGSFGPQEITLNRELFHVAIQKGLLTYEDRTTGADIGGPNRPRKGQLRDFRLWLDSPQEVRVLERTIDTHNLIGLQYLLRFNVIFDFPQSKIYVQPRKPPKPTVDWKDKSGLSLLRAASDLVVADVRPQSPAAKNDIRSSDVIVAIDSVPSAKYRLTPLRLKLCEEGKQVKLVVRRGTKEWPVELKLTDYRKPVAKEDFE